MKPLSREQAIAQGLKRYNTGKSCKYGHWADRSVNGRMCTECRKIKAHAYERANPATKKAYLKEWKKQNPELVKGYVQISNVRNPEIRRRASRVRRAHKRTAKGRHCSKDIVALFVKQEGACAGLTCKVSLAAYHVDHKTPISRGGSNWPKNLQLLCAFCNISKGAKTQREWYRCLGI